MVCWKAASNGSPGRLLVGDAAENESVLAPQSAVRCPKYKISQDFMLLGSERIRVTDAIGQIFRYVLAEAVPRQGGHGPAELRLTHPARWGEGRLGKLREAAAVAGFDDPLLIPEPVAAAVYFAKEELRPGNCVAVYDLGGGTFDTAVLRRVEDGFEVVGTGGWDDLGGEDFDERLYEFLAKRLDAEQWHTLTRADSQRLSQRSLHAFKVDVRRAKERLSREPDATVLTPLPGQPDMRVSRSDFEGLVREDIERTVQELKRTIDESGQSVEGLSAIYLAGGSSKIPLVSRLIEERLGKRPSVLGDPKAVTALGAIRAPAKHPQASEAPRHEAPAQPEPGQTGPAPNADQGSGRDDMPRVRNRRVFAIAAISLCVSFVVLGIIVAMSSGGGTTSSNSPGAITTATTTAVTPTTTVATPTTTPSTTPMTSSTAGNPTSSPGNLTACDQNISAGPVTSCPFAENVFVAYSKDYTANGEQSSNTITAYSPVTHQSYSMDCTNDGKIVNCTGGNNSFVTFPFHAVQVY